MPISNSPYNLGQPVSFLTCGSVSRLRAMINRTRVHVIAATAAALLAAACYGVPVSAALAARTSAVAKPSVTFSFVNDKIAQSAKPEFTYQTTHLPKGSVRYLQDQVGSAHVWENVEKLIRSSATVTAPKVAMGKYLYRIRVSRRGRTVVTSRNRPLYVYGKITFSVFCGPGGWSPCPPQTVQIGTTIFTYVIGSYAGTYPSYENLMKINSTSCKTLTIRFATNDSNSGTIAYLQVVQSRTNPQYGQTPTGTIGTKTFKLDGGPFYINFSETTGSEVFFNGSAICYTHSGLP
jgi:hypothetical protein